MLGSDWRKDLEFGLIALACALLLGLPIAGLMLGEYAEVHRTNAAYQQNAEKDRAAAGEEISKSCFVGDFAKFSDCITRNLETYYKQQATNQDLQAQQDMAYWAKALFFLGCLQAILSGVGIFYVWRTLVLSRTAVQAAVESNEVSRELGEAQTRAYLFCKSAKFKIDKSALIISVEIENVGQSPASNVVISGNITIQFLIGPPGRRRVGGWIESEKINQGCQPIVSNGSILEDVWLFKDSFLVDREDEGEVDRVAAIFESGDDMLVSLTIAWSDVFGKQNDFVVNMDANVKRPTRGHRAKIGKRGKLDVRMRDARHRVAAGHPRDDESYG